MQHKDIYIIRHGQTDSNAKGIIQGKGVNLPLNEKGRWQASKFFEAYEHKPFDVVYTSTLLRAQETVAGFVAKGIRHEVRSALDEISWGHYEGQQSTFDSDPVFLQMLKEWRGGNLSAKPENGESPLELQARQQPFVEELKSAPYQTILVCMHGRAIRCLMCTLTGTPLERMDEFEHSNLCLYQLWYTNDRFQVVQHNSTDHLRG